MGRGGFRRRGLRKSTWNEDALPDEREEKKQAGGCREGGEAKTFSRRAASREEKKEAEGRREGRPAGLCAWLDRGAGPPLRRFEAVAERMDQDALQEHRVHL